ncbi:MAG TPA: immune inhibitor A domain-containing protein [Gaiellaceae bacterium]|jgi:immune inhibitor A
MRRLSWAVALAVLGALVATAGAAVGTAHGGSAAYDRPKSVDTDRPSPQGVKLRALRKEAIELQLNGKIARNAKVAQIGRDRKGKGDRKGHRRTHFVELERDGEDTIWTVLAEFGDQTATHDHGSFGTIDHGGTPGPMHNQIPEPDRSVDNTTIWAPNFDVDYYNNLLFSEAKGFSSMRNFYIENSSGQYAVNGKVEDWVEVPYNEAAYGSDYCGDIVCVADIQRLLQDELTAWYDHQVDDLGKTPAEVNAYLSQFDRWDRYDYDGDGNFDEPDGYIDHFQSIHAGEGEETGGGAQGTDAIWSHRSYTNVGGFGKVGPSFNKFGGVQVGQSDYWIGDYTIEPENGGVGVFAHEFGHDLGLPDEYDTSGNTGGAENSTGFWTPWSSGSYGSDGTPEDGIGNRPFSMSSWDKLQLGWLDYQLIHPGDGQTNLTLGPSEARNTAGKQAAVVTLPDRQVTTQLGSPFSGTKFYYSSTGNDMDNTMVKSVTLPATGASLTAKARYNIEQDFDYAYLIVSTDGGATFDTVHTNLSSPDDPNGQNFGEGITGVSTNGDWVDLTADLSAYAGQTVEVGFEYTTDPAQEGTPGAPYQPGFSLDDIAIGGQPVDGAETDGGWTFDPDTGGFHATTGTETTPYFNAYVVENRQYVGPDELRVGFDGPLKNAPYNFGGTVGPKWAERFPYEDGVLIWYWNTQYANNNVGDHPGEGEILPVDAHPDILHWSDGSVLRPRLQSYDSTFGVKKTDRITLHLNGVPATFDSLPGVSVFDDTKSWWTASDSGDALGHYQASWSSVNVPQTGTRVEVKGNTKKDHSVNLEITPAPAS